MVAALNKYRTFFPIWKVNTWIVIEHTTITKYDITIWLKVIGQEKKLNYIYLVNEIGLAKVSCKSYY